MAIGEIVAVGLVLKALSSSSGPPAKPDDAPPRDKSAGPGGGGGGSVDPGAVIGSGVALGAAILGKLFGGGVATAGGIGGAAAGGATTTGGAAGAKGGAVVGVGVGVSAAAVAAVVIVVVWVVLVVLTIFQLFEAASRRTYAAGLGKSGIRALTAQRLRAKETEFARKMVSGLGGIATPHTAADPITGISGLSLEQMRAVGTAARFLAVEQMRGLTSSVQSHFQTDFGHSAAQVAANGDAMELGDFDALVAEHYQSGPLILAGEAGTWGEAQALVPAETAAKARFGGRLWAVSYVWDALKGGSQWGLGYTATDEANAAAANPPGENTIAYLNRTFGLGQEQKANVLFDNEARMAWLPNHSFLNNPTGAAMLFPYETKPFVVRGTGA